jgi:hypothetical protein
MSKVVVFAATCPNCEREQLQDRFTLEDLVRLLKGDFPIEAHCGMCDKFWSISLPKRAELGAMVVALLKDGVR